MKRRLVALVVSAAALAGGASAQTPPAAAPATPVSPVQVKAPTTPPDDQVVCKSEMVTGSRFPTKTCHTAYQWAQIAADSKATAQSYQNHAAMTAGH
jgi:hypothetical protein